MNLNEFLIQARENKGMTQKHLAKKLGIVSPQLISNWERGLCTPPIKKLNKLSEILEIEFDPTFEMVMKWKSIQAKNKAISGNSIVKKLNKKPK